MTNEKKKKEEKKKSDAEEKIESLEREKNEYLEGWKRARADFVNYKKHEKSRLVEAKKREREKLIKEILDVVDNFEVAEKNIPKEKIGDDCVQGLLNIKKQLIKLLQDYGLESIDSVGQEFDPNLHEAVSMVESEKDSGTVVEEVRKGYLLNGELIKPARVKVAK